MVSLSMKICVTCKESKEKDEFHWANKSKGLLHAKCKSCRSIAKPREWEIEGKRTCNYCNIYKPVDEFNKRPSGIPYSKCKQCMKNDKIKQSPCMDSSVQRICATCQERKSILEFSANVHQPLGRSNICKPCRVTHFIEINYGISAQKMKQLKEAQGNACAICQKVFASGPRSVHIDHDHSCCPSTKSCGKCIRGLLCGACNVGLGTFKDSPEILLNAANYLREVKYV